MPARTQTPGRTTTGHPLEQRWPRLKRNLLRPIAPVALRVGQGRAPLWLRELALEKAALPYLRARDDEFERRIEEGVFVGHTTDLLSLYVLAFGVWEPYLSSFVRDRLHEGDVFVDVGANCGWYTLLGARQVGPSGTVIAVEPSAAIIERLRRQLERNRLDNVRVVEEAVSDHVGRVAIEPGPAEHTGLTRAIEESQAPESVPCRPLPQMMGASEWARVRLMKIDVEGA
ncbi:MAG: FkbM family methyltransferase, partial [Actinobacteria bacterium]|nr:FkbM family methyltransferase [Actinomycetota bacterium]